jgi:hypothetical protein
MADENIKRAILALAKTLQALSDRVGQDGSGAPGWDVLSRVQDILDEEPDHSQGGDHG